MWVEVNYPRCISQLEKYKIEEKAEIKPDIVIIITQKMIDDYIESGKDSEILKGWSLETARDEVEYMLAGQIFYHQILRYDGMLVHSSAIVLDGKSYLFSGKSGAGKSTHTRLWLEKFGEKVYILNEDKPAVRRINGRYYAYGTPWSGKTNTNVNRKEEIAGIVFLGQAPDNSIRMVDTKEAFSLLFEQTDRKVTGPAMMALMDLMEGIVTEVPIYRLDCNISYEAVEVAYEAIVDRCVQNEIDK